MATVIISEHMLGQKGPVLIICWGNRGHIRLFLNKFFIFEVILYFSFIIFYI